MSTQIQIRRDTTANWESVNPALADGEIGYDITANRFKVGNGTDAWVDIEYSGGSSAHVGDSPPADPVVEGAQWFNTDNGTLYIYYDNNGSPEWVSASGGSSSGTPPVHVGDSPPADPVEGVQWLNTDDGYLYIYYDNAGDPTWMAVERQP